MQTALLKNIYTRCLWNHGNWFVYKHRAHSIERWAENNRWATHRQLIFFWIQGKAILNFTQRNEWTRFTFYKDHSYDTLENGWKSMGEQDRNKYKKKNHSLCYKIKFLKIRNFHRRMEEWIDLENNRKNHSPKCEWVPSSNE